MRVPMNFMHRDGWSFHILATDCKTVLVGYRSVVNKETLLSMVSRMGGNVEVAKQNIRRWGHGSVWINPSPTQCRALGIPDPGHEARTR
jgi:hypothetical protein